MHSRVGYRIHPLYCLTDTRQLLREAARRAAADDHPLARHLHNVTPEPSFAEAQKRLQHETARIVEAGLDPADLPTTALSPFFNPLSSTDIQDYRRFYDAAKEEAEAATGPWRRMDAVARSEAKDARVVKTRRDSMDRVKKAEKLVEKLKLEATRAVEEAKANEALERGYEGGGEDTEAEGVGFEK